MRMIQRMFTRSPLLVSDAGSRAAETRNHTQESRPRGRLLAERARDGLLSDPASRGPLSSAKTIGTGGRLVRIP